MSISLSRAVRQQQINHLLGNSWVNLDPLTISQMLLRVQKQHEALVSHAKHMESITSHYGPRFHRCTYAFCQHSYRGFDSQNDRDAHIKNHGKPWKCSTSNCDFSTIGFSTKARRNEHWLKVHISALDQLDDFMNLDVAEAQPVLFTLVMGDDVNGVRRLLSAPGGRQLNNEILDSARYHAAKAGSMAVTRLLTPANDYVPNSIVISAIQSENVDFAKWAVSKAGPWNCSQVMQVMFDTKSEEVYALWEEHLLTVPDTIDRGLTEGHGLRHGFRIGDRHGWFRALFNRTIVGHINSPLKEARMKHTLRKLRSVITPKLLGPLLVLVAKSSCSIPLTEELLAQGAYIDHPRNSEGKWSSTGMTALHIAAKKTTREAALLMQYLILQGACTLWGMKYEQGARGIAKWVGMTWEELETQYRNNRHPATPPPQGANSVNHIRVEQGRLQVGASSHRRFIPSRLAKQQSYERGSNLEWQTDRK